MATEATPRISAAYLASFTNQTVRILGRVTSLRGGDTAVLETPGGGGGPGTGGVGGGPVTVQLNRDAHIRVNSWAEIVGRVGADLSVKAYQALDFGPDIDPKAVEAVVDATHRYKEIFYEG